MCYNNTKGVFMKIIHCSDLHIGSKIDSLPAEKSTIRREEILHAFERLCVFARDNSVRVVIIAGDFFDAKKCAKKIIDRVLYSIKNCPNCDFIYLQGNHDFEFFHDYDKSEIPQNLKSFSGNFSSFRYDNVVIGGITLSEYAISSQYEKITFAPQDFNILTMHGELVEYKALDNPEAVSLTMLKDKNIDYLALGHYHFYQNGNIDGRGQFAYSGCLEGRGFDELDKKGFVLIDTEIENKFIFIPFSSREFYEINFSVSDYGNWLSCRENIIKNLSQNYSEQSAIKLVLSGDREVDFNINLEEIKQRLNEIFFFAKVIDKTCLKISIDSYINDKTLKGEFIRLVYKSDLPDETKNIVVQRGLEALKGELK